MTTAVTPVYVAPATVDESVEALGAEGAAVLGGGTVLMAQTARGEVRPSRLVDLVGVKECGLVTETATGIFVGSTVTYASLLRGAGSVVPLLPEIARKITGGPQIRVQGTAGGSAAYANPASDVPTALVALEASMHLAGPAGRRTVPAAEFFRGAFRTALRSGELLTGMEIPRRAGVRWGYVKLKASESSWPIVTAAARLESAGFAVVAVGGAAEVPVSVTIPWAEGRSRLEPEARSLVDDQLTNVIGTWWEDQLADARYRRRVAAVVAVRAVEAALAKDGI